jgi:iron(III) transport system ATP-binding protein
MYLSLDNVVKVFVARGGTGEVIAVNGVSLGIEQGELVTLLGPSGCGKTTTLRLIAGFEFPTQGEIWLDGIMINDEPPHKRDMSMVFQSYAIFPHLNVYENVAYGLKVQRMSKNEVRERVATVLELVELGGYGDRAPHQLSGGQQQRVALARALVMEPKVLLMDEPLSNLDAKLREQMRTEIRRIQQHLGITSVYVTHDQIEAMTLSDRIVVMNDGVIEQIGTPEQLYRHPRTRFVAGFIGRANFVPGVILDVLADSNDLIIRALQDTMKVAEAQDNLRAGQEVTLIIRPEMIRVVDDAKVKGIVRRASYLGDSIDYDIEVNGQVLMVVETDPSRMVIHPVGSSVGLDWHQECVHVLPSSPG